MRPYELPQKEYGLWYEVGNILGPLAQAAVEVALCEGTPVPTRGLPKDYENLISRMAKRRHVNVAFYR